MTISAGTLLYRINEMGAVEVLLVHHSGESNKDRPWSLPKGMLDEDETPEDAARRETLEEAGVLPPPELTYYGYVRQVKSGRVVHCFAGAALPDSDPYDATWEIDKAAFLPLAEALECVYPANRVFIRMLIDDLMTFGRPITGEKSNYIEAFDTVKFVWEEPVENEITEPKSEDDE